MTDVPTVSVVLPVYNAEATLGEAIDSILHQTFQDFELLVVDDGSTDSSRELAEARARSDTRVLAISRPHSGLIATLNHGIALAGGRFIARMDADDISIRDRFQRQVEFLQHHPGVGAVGGTARLMTDDGPLPLLLRVPSDPQVVARELEEAAVVIHPSVMVRRRVYNELGGYRPAFLGAEDYDLWLRMIEKHPIANLPDVVLLYRYGVHRESVRKAAQQVLSFIAAKFCHRERLEGKVDPGSSLEGPVNRAWLTSRGIPESVLDRELIERLEGRSWWLARMGLLEDAEALAGVIGDVEVGPGLARVVRATSLWARARVAVARGRRLGALSAITQGFVAAPVFMVRRLTALATRKGRIESGARRPPVVPEPEPPR